MASDKGVEWVPDACTLPTSELPLRLAEFDDFLGSVQRLTRLRPTRLDLVVSRDMEAAGRDLAARESECCSFFDFDFEPAGADVVIHVSVPIGHVDVLDALEARATAARGGDRCR